MIQLSSLDRLRSAGLNPSRRPLFFPASSSVPTVFLIYRCCSIANRHWRSERPTAPLFVVRRSELVLNQLGCQPLQATAQTLSELIVSSQLSRTTNCKLCQSIGSRPLRKNRNAIALFFWRSFNLKFSCSGYVWLVNRTTEREREGLKSLNLRVSKCARRSGTAWTKAV